MLIKWVYHEFIILLLIILMGSLCPTCRPRSNYEKGENECVNAEISIGLPAIQYHLLEPLLLVQGEHHLGQKNKSIEGQQTIDDIPSIYQSTISIEKFEELKSVLHETKNYSGWYSFYESIKDPEGYSVSKILTAAIVCNNSLDTEHR